jgi:hypothetical protein
MSVICCATDRGRCDVGCALLYRVHFGSLSWCYPSLPNPRLLGLENGSDRNVKVPFSERVTVDQNASEPSSGKWWGIRYQQSEHTV